MKVYICSHYADPFVELQFSSLVDAQNYVNVYEALTGKKMKIKEVNKNVDV